MGGTEVAKRTGHQIGHQTHAAACRVPPHASYIEGAVLMLSGGKGRLKI